jgi:hypothetical protein
LLLAKNPKEKGSRRREDWRGTKWPRRYSSIKLPIPPHHHAQGDKKQPVVGCCDRVTSEHGDLTTKSAPKVLISPITSATTNSAELDHGRTLRGPISGPHSAGCLRRIVKTDQSPTRAGDSSGNETRSQKRKVRRVEIPGMSGKKSSQQRTVSLQQGCRQDNSPGISKLEGFFNFSPLLSSLLLLL